MPDYRKMYALLCGAIDDVIDPLEQIPRARPQAQRLRLALLAAKELYVADGESDTVRVEDMGSK